MNFTNFCNLINEGIEAYGGDARPQKKSRAMRTLHEESMRKLKKRLIGTGMGKKSQRDGGATPQTEKEKKGIRKLANSNQKVAKHGDTGTLQSAFEGWEDYNKLTEWDLESALADNDAVLKKHDKKNKVTKKEKKQGEEAAKADSKADECVRFNKKLVHEGSGGDKRMQRVAGALSKKGGDNPGDPLHPKMKNLEKKISLQSNQG